SRTRTIARGRAPCSTFCALVAPGRASARYALTCSAERSGSLRPATRTSPLPFRSRKTVPSGSRTFTCSWAEAAAGRSASSPQGSTDHRHRRSRTVMGRPSVQAALGRIHHLAVLDHTVHVPVLGAPAEDQAVQLGGRLLAEGLAHRVERLRGLLPEVQDALAF